jgi:hypothetical protein
MATFETKVCGRCGGSGKYSFNLMHGDMCYGCKGAGTVYTKRGLAAKQFFEDSLSVLAEDIKVGDGIRCWTGINKFYVVTEAKSEVQPDGRTMIELVMGNSVYCCYAGSKIRLAADKPTKQAKLAAALEYQASLTAQGKVAKRAAKKA